MADDGWWLMATIMQVQSLLDNKSEVISVTGRTFRKRNKAPFSQQELDRRTSVAVFFSQPASAVVNSPMVF